jgi:hypothetical protein
MKGLKACSFGMVFMLSVAGMSYGSDSAYDQMNGSGDAWHTAIELAKPGGYGSSLENARERAGLGFDDKIPPNLRDDGMQYNPPIPKPKIEKTENNE